MRPLGEDAERHLIAEYLYRFLDGLVVLLHLVNAITQTHNWHNLQKGLSAGGPIIDRLARKGNPKAFTFSKPHIPGYNYSFSGLKTSFLYSLRDWLKEDPDFIEKNLEDLAASLEATVVDILMDKLRKVAKDKKIKEVAVAGGVSANNGLRNAFHDHAKRFGWNIYIPKFSYTTDNAAMIAITGYYKYLDKDFCSIDMPAYSRVTI